MLDELAQLGVDVNDGLNRLMNNATLYEKLLKKLPDAIESQEILGFIDSGEIKTATDNAHKIKGANGNLSVTPLYRNYTEIVNLLRAGDTEGARKLYLETLPIQGKIFEIIKKF